MIEKFIDAVGKIDHFDLPRASETRHLIWNGGVFI